MKLTLKQLRAFVSVVDAGSFTEAANKLGVTQSSLSLLLRELESELDLRLLDRGRRQLRLTIAGAEFYPMAVKVLDELDYAVRSTLQLQDRQRGSIKLGCTLLYGHDFIPEVVASFKALYPAILVSVIDSPNADVLERVRSGEVDFGIAPQRPASKGLIQESLFQDRIQLICPATHALARLKRVTWADVLEYPFITLPMDFTARLQADLHACSSALTLVPEYSVSYLTTALGMVKWGLGVTALPGRSLPLLAAYGLVAVPVSDPVVRRQLSVFVKRHQALSPAAESLLAFLREKVASYPG